MCDINKTDNDDDDMEKEGEENKVGRWKRRDGIRRDGREIRAEEGVEREKKDVM